MAENDRMSDDTHDHCWHTTDEGEWCCYCEGVNEPPPRIPPGSTTPDTPM